MPLSLHITIILIFDIYPLQTHKHSQKKSSQLRNEITFQLLSAEGLGCQAAFLTWQGDYSTAESLYKQSLDVRRKALGDNHYKVASTIAHLGNLALLSYDFETASRLIEQSLALRQTAFKGQVNHHAVAASIYLKARLLQALGNYKESEKLFQQSLEMRTAVLGEEHPAVAQSLLGLGQLYTDMRHCREAQEHFDKVIPMLRKCFHVNNVNIPSASGMGSRVSRVSSVALNHRSEYEVHLAVADNMTKCGLFLHANVEYLKAEEMIQALLPSSNVTESLQYNILSLKRADLGVSMCQADDAKKLIGPSGKVLAKMLGSCHSLVADGVVVMARIMIFDAKYAAAIDLLKRALQMYAPVYGRDHPRAAYVHELLAEASLAPGYHQEAMMHQQLALEMHVLTCGSLSAGNFRGGLLLYYSISLFLYFSILVGSCFMWSGALDSSGVLLPYLITSQA